MKTSCDKSVNLGQLILFTEEPNDYTMLTPLSLFMETSFNDDGFINHLENLHLFVFTKRKSYQDNNEGISDLIYDLRLWSTHHGRNESTLYATLVDVMAENLRFRGLSAVTYKPEESPYWTLFKMAICLFISQEERLNRFTESAIDAMESFINGGNLMELRKRTTVEQYDNIYKLYATYRDLISPTMDYIRYKQKSLEFKSPIEGFII